MAQDHLSPEQWTNICKKIARDCERRALSAMHFTFLFSQDVDAAMDQLPEHCVERARSIAEAYGYENRTDRQMLARWISTGYRQSGDSAFGHVA